MPESYTKPQIEAALSENGFSRIQESDGLSIYQTNYFPGDDLVLDWAKGQYEWGDLKKQLDDQGVDSKPIHDSLSHG